MGRRSRWQRGVWKVIVCDGDEVVVTTWPYLVDVDRYRPTVEAKAEGSESATKPASSASTSDSSDD